MRVINYKVGGGLGYTRWLVLDSYGACDVLFIPGQFPGIPQAVAHCHPAIPANAEHASALGVNLGDIICGVRWTEDYQRGAPVANPEQARECQPPVHPNPGSGRELIDFLYARDEMTREEIGGALLVIDAIDHAVRFRGRPRLDEVSEAREYLHDLLEAHDDDDE